MTAQEELEIRERLRTLAAADDALSAPPELETRLVEAFRNRQSRPPRARAWAVAAVAAGLALASALLTSRAPLAPAPAADLEDTAFVPLTYGDPLSDVDAVHVVRVALDRSTLASYGLPSAGGESGSVAAEILVGQDGLARGIRFVN
jgi:hypothetical protein